LTFSTIRNYRKNRGLEICISRPFSALVGGSGNMSNFLTDLQAVADAKWLFDKVDP